MLARYMTVVLCAVTGLVWQTPAAAEAVEAKGATVLEPVMSGQWRFGGEMGRRVDANVEQWLLRAPEANPGILDMFERRDSNLPYPQVVDWAGEFAGKYLISAVQALDMTDDPRLEPYVKQFVEKLIDTQAEDGYLGPFPKSERLLSHWDLWGHYHCMLGLLMWYDRTGDERALQCVTRAADLMCDIYVGTDRRPVQAGAPETNNLAVVHVLANLYKRTGNPRYLELVRVIEEDMTTVGDWLQQGEAGTPFFLLIGQGERWESLHIIQGLAEMYRITGEERYEKAVLNFWESIQRYDRHPSGAFSTSERGMGTVYGGGAIETCCSVGWLALTLDVLELTGDAHVADELELTTWNQVLAAQHPSGSWCTYDTPMKGLRYPSYHQINFQARPSGPELNCCSVNGPRGLGILGAWAVMEEAAASAHPALVVNFYGPGTFEMVRSNDNPVTLTQETRYPVEGAVRLMVSPKKKETFALNLRIPAWSSTTTVSVNGKPLAETPTAGTYCSIERTWKKGDVVELVFDMSPRVWTGTALRVGQVALHTGPLLLAYDTYDNPIEVEDLKPLDMKGFTLTPVDVEAGSWTMGQWKTRTNAGDEVVLTDFASAGAHGTYYTSWIPAENAAPPEVLLQSPVNEAVTGPGTVVFDWVYNGAAKGYHYELVVAKDAAFSDIVLRETLPQATCYVAQDRFAKPGTYYWTVRGVNEHGASADPSAPWAFTVDAASPPLHGYVAPQPGGPLVASPLDGSGTTTAGLTAPMGGSVRAGVDRFGAPDKAVQFWSFWWSPATMRFKIPAFPEQDYSVALWLCPDEGFAPDEQWIFSAWTTFGDDPLRLVAKPEGLVALVETEGAIHTTAPVPIQKGNWVHVAAVKHGESLTLYMDGDAKQTFAVPLIVHSPSTALGLSSNPALGSHGDRFVGRMDDFAFYPRALTQEEVTSLAEQ